MTHDSFQAQVIADLAVLKADIKSLVGNGQPGRVGKLEEDVKELNAHRNQMVGKISIIAFLVAAIVSGAIAIAHNASVDTQRHPPAIVQPAR